MFLSSPPNFVTHIILMSFLKTGSNQQITFEDLPHAIAVVLNRLEKIELLLAAKASESSLKPPIATKELCKFLNVTEPTLTRYRKRGIIPYLNIGSAIRYDLNKVINALENKKKQK
jgi:Helix-turn-helix domain